MKKAKTNANTHPATETQSTGQFTQIKLGIDVHADFYVVVRQIDSATPQPAQRMSPAKFLEFAARQLALARKVHACYEAGPFGYGLHRQLTALGVDNVVVRPQNWDEHGRGVKTDRTDALALVQRLDRFVQGNTKALAVIAVPTPAQEQERALSRLREQAQRDRQAHEAQGRSLLLAQGHRVRGRWWKAKTWEQWQASLPEWLVGLLEHLRAMLLAAETVLGQVQAQIEAQAQAQPKGFGRLTSEILRREVFDWNRFKNRRQVASLTGLCPGVRASGLKCRPGSITKHGNPRLRRALVELAWRVVRFQPCYPPVVKWKPVLAQKHNRGARKKAIVAIGRRLAIDLWRLSTGRCTALALGLA